MPEPAIDEGRCACCRLTSARTDELCSNCSSYKPKSKYSPPTLTPQPLPPDRDLDLDPDAKTEVTCPCCRLRVWLGTRAEYDKLSEAAHQFRCPPCEAWHARR